MDNLVERTVQGVSIVTATNRPDFLKNVFANFQRQHWPRKELIIILNNDAMDLEEWLNYAEGQEHISVIQVPEEVSLGHCLNKGVNMAIYDFIAKFDDDDYYGPCFLSEAMHTFFEKDADVVGKRTCFMYNKTTREMRLRFPGNENKKAFILQGGTIMARKKVLKKIPFPNKNVKEGLHFLQRCRARGYRIYSTSRYHFAYIRHENQTHTWNPSSAYFRRTSVRIGYLEDYKNAVTPPTFEKYGEGT